MQKADSLDFFKLINDIIVVTSSFLICSILNPEIAKKNINRMEEIRKVEGSSYGCPIVAFFDGIFIFLQKLFVRTKLIPLEKFFIGSPSKRKQKDQRIFSQHARKWTE